MNPTVPSQLMKLGRSDSIGSRREPVIVVSEKQLHAKPKLPQLGTALYSPGPGPRGCQRGKQQRGQYRDDRNDYQKLNQGKSQKSCDGAGWLRFLDGDAWVHSVSCPFG
jgi:hypothetical protein